LHDPVGRQVQSDGEGTGFPLDGEQDRDTCLAHLLHQGVDLVQARLRAPPRHTLGIRPEQPHEAPHLNQRLASRVLDAAESRQRLLRLRGGDLLRRSGLGDDNAHVVRDHVV
jgi:hypothetical protein